ncbi:MAG: GNAT family N-acetyltransferase [Acidimicrobiales bacterium]
MSDASSPFPSAPPDDPGQALVSLRTRRLQLRPLRPEDHRLLYRLALDPDVTFDWRLRGTTPSFEEFQRQIHPSVLCQFAVSPIGSMELFGLVVAFSADLRNRFCHAGVVMRPELRRRGLGIEAIFGLSRYLFTGWDFRLVLLETTGRTFAHVASMEKAGIVTVEGRIRDQYYFGGRYWDGIILTHRRQQFDALMASRLGRSLLLPGRPVVRTR